MEDAGIKLSAAASDIMGVSGRAMLEALISGDRDPAGLADLAKRRLRSKIPELTEALTGRFNEHHAFLGPQPASGAESSHPMVRLGAALLTCGNVACVTFQMGLPRTRLGACGNVGPPELVLATIRQWLRGVGEPHAEVVAVVAQIAYAADPRPRVTDHAATRSVHLSHGQDSLRSGIGIR
jgi:hypothetical protein